MIQHFSFKPLYNEALPGWVVTFFYKRERYRAEYNKEGDIRWLDATPPDEENVKKYIHDLMLFHVYE
ncbi:YheE family protein [Caryophanon tenue]|uniref:YheE family protein n=1 Tax=Caryophanon tenue TaxID=33978 RepID=A0A1C0YIP2_9BACL|nr:YheE family protein [Caryophanon tenue]OCS87037.1 hypothetical protein A6M13_11785 [Caryophanon tenue]